MGVSYRNEEDNPFWIMVPEISGSDTINCRSVLNFWDDDASGIESVEDTDQHLGSFASLAVTVCSITWITIRCLGRSTCTMGLVYSIPIYIYWMRLNPAGRAA